MNTHPTLDRELQAALLKLPIKDQTAKLRFWRAAAITLLVALVVMVAIWPR